MREDPTEAEGTLLKEFGVTQDFGVAAQLGELYRNAGPPVQDDEKASYYLRRAANGGAIWSMIALADMLLKGKGSEPQPELAVELLEKASRTGDAAQMASAEASLGDYYRRAGEPRKALTAFETAAAGGAIWPAISLAQMLLEGEGVAADPPRAIALLQGAARNGDDAQMSAAEGALGAYYRRAGEPEKAVAAFRRAAASGGIWPKIMLAEMLLQGEGAETDTDRAIALLVEVSRTGDAAQVGSAQGILGQHYLATGQPAKAAEAFEAGANTGAVWPAISLAQILLAGTAGAADPARGIGLLEQAIQDGDAMQQASALGSLGSYYRSIGDTTKALAALERARELGVQAWPMVMLAEMVARGEGVSADPERAVRILEAAVQLDATVVPLTALFSLHAKRFEDEQSIRAALGYLHTALAADRDSALQAIGDLSDNSTTAIVQTVLRDAAIYSGPINGMLTAESLSAIARYCAQRE